MLDNDETKVEESTEEKKQELVEVENQLMALPLDQQEEQIVGNIINAATEQELQAQFDLFNMAQRKKNAIRVVKMSGLLGQVEDQMIKRFTERPDQVSNKELLEYMQVVSAQVEKASTVVATAPEKPMVTIKDPKTQININVGPKYDSDDKEAVMDAVNALLKQLAAAPKEKDVVDVDYTESSEQSAEIKIIQDQEDDIVYNDNDSIAVDTE